MTNFVIFGASGDLARNYLYPALVRCYNNGNRFNYFGFGRKDLTQKTVDSFGLPNFCYITGSYDSVGIAKLAQHISSDSVFYFALPIHFELIKDLINGLLFHRLLNSKSQLIFEKPFGTDHNSAKKLMNYLSNSVGKSKVFLVDHYLTKDLIKNIISLRFSNPIFYNLWNRKFVKEINITITETDGIASRSEYYEKTGAIRDMIQNHGLQLLMLTVMESPEEFSQTSYSKAKMHVLEKLSFSPDIEIGQYKGYLKEKGVSSDSTTETFAKVKFYLNNNSWRGVPITITTGKKNDKNTTEINVVFKSPESCIWGEKCHLLANNQLTISLRPENDIILTINSSFNPHKKFPTPVTLNLGSLDGSLKSSLAYQNMIQDLIEGVLINSPTFKEILLQWKITDKILKTPNIRKKLFLY